MKAYFAFMDKYYPEGDKLNTVNTYGYSTAELLVQILRQCGDDLTRENIMRQATSLKNVDRQPGAARHDGQHLADRLPHQQADADDEVQRRALGTVRPDHRGHRPGRLAPPIVDPVARHVAGVRLSPSAPANSFRRRDAEFHFSLTMAP